MLADQARYDDEEGTNGVASIDGEVELTEENADDIINLINSL
ncbi:hypothetical protein M2451_002645 [Dysgonomonas sp. PFB1-18]|jgi:hypothetical protein|nr:MULTISPECIES: hypothetical protein [unclassified Dysgonomonas]MDH6308126.1 hypothetical protein [Dysgonomonas sp. PF1-14]MDH6339665.1 hypothetical protein [Dysgonomonas sp. PF1-16]MDH6381316.1 hypothetical protein [Dysgonomonas sp. PFB1-18]MDH6398528.1 hypothetical protein [Dysgonomonas sp. PF1-23]